jgi:serine/threonine-protein kinase
MTQAGLILGTAAYMSPEQAKGRDADKSSDLWAFGTVLYEMLTGTRAFDGDDTNDTIANVLRDEPDWSRVPASVPPAVGTLMRQCLAKDRRQRVSEMATARFVLTKLAYIDATSPQGTESAPRSRMGFGLAIAGAAVLGATVVGGAMWALRFTPRPSESVQFSITLPGDERFATATSAVAISPDGTEVAYAANGRILVRSLNELEPREIAGSRFSGTGGGVPIFAPDGLSIAFFSGGGVTGTEPGVTLNRLPIGGGAAERLSTVDYPYGGSWGTDGILIGQGPGGIVRVPASGGTAQQVVTVAPAERAMEPQMLPDGRTILFTLTTVGDDEFETAKVVAQSTVDGARRVLRERASGGRYSKGHLWYLVDATMFVVPFDAAQLAVTGSPVSVLNGVRRSVLGTADLSISDTGNVVYRPGPPLASSLSRTLVIADTSSDPSPLKVPSARFVHPRVSPDGRTVAVSRTSGPMSDIWVYDVKATTEIRRLTFDGTNRFPVWSADSQRITFQSAREGDRAIWWEPARGGAVVRLTRPAAGEEHVPESWSRDGRRLLFSLVTRSKITLWVYTLDTMAIEQFGKSESSDLFSSSFSPDGRWVVYAANAGSTGFLSINRGVYVEPFPATGERHQAPKRGLDYHPVWAPDGKTIFYVSTLGGPLESVPIALHPSVAFGTPTRLARGPRPAMRSTETRGFDTLPDGRFVSLAPVPDETAGARPELRVLLNWSQSLRSATGATSTTSSLR